jgi:hypothetical protein
VACRIQANLSCGTHSSAVSAVIGIGLGMDAVRTAAPGLTRCASPCAFTADAITLLSRSSGGGTHVSAGSTVIQIQVCIDTEPAAQGLMADTLTTRAGRSCLTRSAAGSTVTVIRVCVDAVPAAQGLTRRATTLTTRAGHSCRTRSSAGPTVAGIRLQIHAHSVTIGLVKITGWQTGNRGCHPLESSGCHGKSQMRLLRGDGNVRTYERTRVSHQAHLAAGRVQQVRVITELRNKYYRKDHDSNANHRVYDLLIRTTGGCSGATS